MAKYLPVHGIDVAALALTAGDSVQFRGDIIGVPGVSHFYTPRPRYVLIRAVQEALRIAGIYQPVLGKWRDTAIAAGSEIMRRYRPEMVLATYPPVEALEIGLALASRHSLPFVADFRDGLLFEPLEVRSLKRPAVRAHYARLEANVCQRARLITTVSRPISDYFTDTYGHPNVLTVPNGFDPDELAAASTNSSIHLERGRVHVAHTGHFGGSRAGRHLGALLAALDHLRTTAPGAETRLRLHLVGGLTPREVLQCRRSACRDMLQLWGERPRGDALAVQRQADALLLVVPKGQRSVVTGKLFEYLAAGRPILALAEGTTAGQIVEETGSGVVVPVGDIPRVSALLQDLLGGRLSVRRNEPAIRQYTRSVQMELLAKALLRV